MVTEYAPKGDLRSFIQNTKMTWKIVHRIATTVTQAMVWLHSMKPPIIHCDLKANNVLVFGENGDTKLTDFGIAQVASNHKRANTVYGKIQPPEGKLSIHSDVFMFGLMMFEVCTKETPDVDTSFVIVPQITSKSNPNFVEFIQKCCKEKPKERPPFKVLYNLLKEIPAKDTLVDVVLPKIEPQIQVSFVKTMVNKYKN